MTIAKPIKRRFFWTTIITLNCPPIFEAGHRLIGGRGDIVPTIDGVRDEDFAVYAFASLMGFGFLRGYKKADGFIKADAAGKPVRLSRFGRVVILPKEKPE